MTRSHLLATNGMVQKIDMKVENFNDGIFYFVYCFDTKYLTRVLNKIKNFRITEDYNTDTLKSIYRIYKNREYFIDNCLEENKKIVQLIIKLLMAKFENQYNSFKIVEDLIDIDETCVKKFFEYISRHSLKIDREYIIPVEKRAILWNLDKERSFMLETRIGRVSKNILTNNIIEWINIHNDRDILIQGEQCETCKLLNNKGCISKYIKGKCQGRTVSMSPKLIGAKSEYDKLFSSIDMTDKRKLNKLDSINLLEYFDDDGIKLFNKSYIEILYTWSNENGTEVRNKIYENIKEYVDILNIYIKKEIENTTFRKFMRHF
jgi:hypothetical protein